MPVIEKAFRWNESIILPKDTVILYPGNSVCSDDISGQFLAVSADKASYFALGQDLLETFQALLRGETIENAYTILSESHDQPLDRMRELLICISISGFLEDAVPSQVEMDGAILHFYTTNACNLQCAHCYMSSGHRLSQGELSREEKVRILDLFAEVYPGGTVTFTGGEALLDADIWLLLEKSHDLGLKTQLYTNGTLIDESNVDRIVRVVDILQISLDGATAVVNDSIRGQGSFGRVMRALALLNATDPNEGFMLRLAVTLTPRNALDIQHNLCGMISDLNLQLPYKISIGSASKLGRASSDPSMFSTVEEMRALEARTVRSLAEQGMSSLYNFVPNRMQCTCGMGGSIGISADGGIYPCSITDQPALGNTRDHGARSVMQNVKSFIEATSIDKIDVCSGCEIRYFCGGICRITNLAKAGSYVSSACTTEYRESQIRTMIRRFGSLRAATEVNEAAVADRRDTTEERRMNDVGTGKGTARTARKDHQDLLSGRRH